MGKSIGWGSVEEVVRREKKFPHPFEYISL
jgi:hypothetical protein